MNRELDKRSLAIFAHCIMGNANSLHDGVSGKTSLIVY
jgi:hypothetical protein